MVVVAYSVFNTSSELTNSSASSMGHHNSILRLLLVITGML